MVLAGDILLIAGPPDLVNESKIGTRVRDPKFRPKLQEQAAALRGAKGALLWLVSAGDGRSVAEYKLDSPPMFDGMAVANGRLYISTIDGSVACHAAEQD
jgi:hypothetical protein